MPAASDLNTPYYGGGSAVPDLDLTNEMSELFRFPSTVISSRKFDPVTGIPLWPLVWLISELFTAPFALVSPNRTFMGTVTLPSPFTLSSVIMSRFWLDTLCKFTVTVNLHNVSNQNRLMITLLNVNGLGNVTVPMNVLLGDTNANGAVNSSDISQTKGQSGMPVTGSNFREDITVDGNLNSSHILLLKPKSGTALPPP